MAGSGVALRLHEFREWQDARKLDGQTRPPRLGRDVNGLYPGQLGRVHTVHSKDYGRRSQSVHHDPNPPCAAEFQQSFDVRTLRAVTVLCNSNTVLGQRPLQTTYQEQFGLQAPLFPQ